MWESVELWRNKEAFPIDARVKIEHAQTGRVSSEGNGFLLDCIGDWHCTILFIQSSEIAKNGPYYALGPFDMCQKYITKIPLVQKYK